jgi:membrane-bound lytic murein transglycosylase D
MAKTNVAHWCLLALAVSALNAYAADTSPRFPLPSDLEPDVRFWTRVYTEVDTNGGFIHDERDLSVIYETVQFPPQLSERGRRQEVRKRKQHYRAILLKLARGKRQGLNEEQQRVLDLWPPDVSRQTLRAAAYRLRFQLGQANRFREGLIRAGAWEAYIRQTLVDMDLPVQLVALPHVESSYNPLAYSHVGAAGMWQLTRSTGRRYLRIDSVVDERLDPYRATVAAARLLEHNHDVTGTWPLAITAYNHGAAGMRRAVRKLGTHDIATIVRQYRSRTFGFSSRNFYPAFLAAVEVHFNAERYFGPLQRDKPVDTDLVRIPAYITANTLQRVLGVDRATLQQSNLALRRAVWNGAKYIPRGYGIRVPRDVLREPADTIIERIAASERYHAQQRDRFYQVRFGDTLSEIAGRLNVSVETLIASNGLHNRHRIRAGQVLRLPPLEPNAGTGTAKMTLVDGQYQVRAGDTLSVIANRFGVSQQALLSANGLADRNMIRAGQVLRVTLAESDQTHALEEPSQATTAASTASSVVPEEHEMTPAEVAKVESAEPASANEAEALGPSLPTAAHPALAADPSDYSVAADSTIEVQAAETLGHYAEWLEVRTASLRSLNRMRYGQPVVVGRRLRLAFKQVSAETFEERRLAYHRALQEAFFARFQISDTREHIVQRGESVWILSHRRFDVPLWLLRQYNPDLDLSALLPGTPLIVPVLESREEPAPEPEPEPEPDSKPAPQSVQLDEHVSGNLWPLDTTAF